MDVAGEVGAEAGGEAAGVGHDLPDKREGAFDKGVEAMPADAAAAGAEGLHREAAGVELEALRMRAVPAVLDAQEGGAVGGWRRPFEAARLAVGLVEGDGLQDARRRLAERDESLAGKDAGGEFHDAAARGAGEVEGRVEVARMEGGVARGADLGEGLRGAVARFAETRFAEGPVEDLQLVVVVVAPLLAGAEEEHGLGQTAGGRAP